MVQWRKPASSQRLRNQAPNPAEVLPYSVTSSVKSPVALLAMISASTGRIGFSETAMRLYRLADRVPLLELSHLLDPPSVESICSVANVLSVPCGVRRHKPGLHGPSEQRREIVAAVLAVKFSSTADALDVAVVCQDADDAGCGRLVADRRRPEPVEVRQAEQRPLPAQPCRRPLRHLQVRISHTALEESNRLAGVVPGEDSAAIHRFGRDLAGVAVCAHGQHGGEARGVFGELVRQSPDRLELAPRPDAYFGPAWKSIYARLAAGDRGSTRGRMPPPTWSSGSGWRIRSKSLRSYAASAPFSLHSRQKRIPALLSGADASTRDSNP